MFESDHLHSGKCWIFYLEFHSGSCNIRLFKAIRTLLIFFYRWFHFLFSPPPGEMIHFDYHCSNELERPTRFDIDMFGLLGRRNSMVQTATGTLGTSFGMGIRLGSTPQKNGKKIKSSFPGVNFPVQCEFLGVHVLCICAAYIDTESLLNLVRFVRELANIYNPAQ